VSVLLDTNVLPEILRTRPDPTVLSWFATQPANGLFVSAVTQAEMMLGARLLPAGKRRQRLEQALEAMFLEDFAGRVLPFDSASAAHYAAVVATRPQWPVFCLPKTGLAPFLQFGSNRWPAAPAPA
jgi:predicted nucleic acid-binding protein